MIIRPEFPHRSGITRRGFLKGSTTLGAATLTSALLPWKSFAALAEGFPVAERLPVHAS